MSKVVILGDTHFGVSKQSDVFHEYFGKFFSFMFSYMETNDITTLIQTGDMFDDRRAVMFNTLHQSKKYFFDMIQAMGIDVHTICGNHDALFKSSNHINSVALLGTDKMNVVDLVPQTISIHGLSIDLYPWINRSNLDTCLEFCSKQESPICVGHFEFCHFPMNPGSMAEEGMDHTLFKRYSKVIQGHYHTQSQRDNILYTGTPYELTWIDSGDPKGFWVLDTHTQEMEFVRNPYTLFYKIDYHDDMGNFDFSTCQEKIIKIILTTKDDPKKFEKFLSKVNENNPIDVKIIDSLIVDSVQQAIGSTDSANITSTQSIIENVVDTFDCAGLDRVKLKRHALSTFSEAMSLINSLQQ